MEKRWIWPFELEEQIGAGAMGVVYRARFVKNSRRYALKLLPPDVAANGTLAARFQREMELLKDLRHPHIVHCFGGTCEGDHQFYAMELVDGGTLASIIEEQGRLPWRQAVEFGLQVCAALEHAHERRIIHRDLKPGNLLITKSGKLKLGDFGLAQMLGETKLTADGKTVGSLPYMAPEQIQGRPPLSNRTDLYALGCVLYEMLTGRPPFRGEAPAEILNQHLRATPAPIASAAVDCPPQLEALIGELLAKSPADRPADAAAVARRLREIDQGVTIKLPRFDRHRTLPAGVGTETVSTDTVSPSRPANRWPIVGLVVAGVAAGWLAASVRTDPQTNAPSQAALLAGLQHTQPGVRIFAAQALGETDPNGAAAALIRQLSDGDALVRVEVVRALGKAHADNDIQLALKKVNREDSQSMVRDAAGEAEISVRNNHAPHGFPWGLSTLVVLGLAIVGGLVWVWRKVSV